MNAIDLMLISNSGEKIELKIPFDVKDFLKIIEYLTNECERLKSHKEILEYFLSGSLTDYDFIIGEYRRGHNHVRH